MFLFHTKGRKAGLLYSLISTHLDWYLFLGVTSRIERYSSGQPVHRISSPLNTPPECVQRRHSLFPRYASVRYRLSVPQPCRTGGRDILSSLNEVGLQHDTHDQHAGFRRAELFFLSRGVNNGDLGEGGAYNIVDDVQLFFVLLLTVTVAAVDLKRRRVE